MKAAVQIPCLFCPLLLSGTERSRMLHDLNIRGDIPETEIRDNLMKIQQKENIHLDELQEKAVFEAVNSGLLVITGAPEPERPPPSTPSSDILKPKHGDSFGSAYRPGCQADDRGHWLGSKDDPPYAGAGSHRYGCFWKRFLKQQFIHRRYAL